MRDNNTYARSAAVLVSVLLVGSVLVAPLSAGVAAADGSAQRDSTDGLFDYGDAPDPEYPTTQGSNGTRHVDPQRVWLGENVTSEETPNQINTDLHDDAFVTNQSSSGELTVEVTNRDAGDDTFYVNLLVDTNGDGDWTDEDEWAVQNHEVTVPAGSTATTGFTVGDEVITYLNGSASEGGYTRLTLTTKPLANYTGHGEYPVGETEDYKREEMTAIASGLDGPGDDSSDVPTVDLNTTVVPDTSIGYVGDGPIVVIDFGDIVIGGDGLGAGDGSDGSEASDASDASDGSDADEREGLRVTDDDGATATAEHTARTDTNGRKTVQPRDLIIRRDQRSSGTDRLRFDALCNGETLQVNSLDERSGADNGGAEQ